MKNPLIFLLLAIGLTSCVSEDTKPVQALRGDAVRVVFKLAINGYKSEIFVVRADSVDLRALQAQQKFLCPGKAIMSAYEFERHYGRDYRRMRASEISIQVEECNNKLAVVIAGNPIELGGPTYKYILKRKAAGWKIKDVTTFEIAESDEDISAIEARRLIRIRTWEIYDT